MLYPGFVGPSNPSQAVVADTERTVNWYLESVGSPGAPTSAALLPTPGLTGLVTASLVGARALWQQGSRGFAVIGYGFYEVSSGWALTLRGTVAMDANPATISYNGTAGGELFITSGGNGYCYDLGTNTLTTVLTGTATMGGHLNGRFLAFDANTGRVSLSALNDGLTWDPTLFFYRSQAPDPWKAMVIRPPEVWLIGEQTGEVWYDSGAYPQPFAPIPGVFFPYGTPAPWSVGVAGGNVTWLSRTANGQGSMVAAQGYVPQPVSNTAVATAIGTMSRTSRVDDCELLVYEQDGHLFACWSFPQARSTWVLDFTLGAWHERGTWDSANARYGAWGPRVHGLLHGTHVVGDRTTGTLSKLDNTVGVDSGGGPIRRMRLGPPLWVDNRRATISRFEVMMETGLGLVSGQGSDPQVMLRTSTNGRTWSSERMASAGKMGDYQRRVFWTRLGSTDRLWVPEVVVSDPIPWRIAGAMIEADGLIGQAVTNG